MLERNCQIGNYDHGAQHRGLVGKPPHVHGQHGDGRVERSVHVNANGVDLTSLAGPRAGDGADRGHR